MQFSKEILKGTAEIIVLRVLKGLNEAYGYELIKAIKAQSHDIFEFQEGTLYPLLYRLEQKGYVESEKKEASNGKVRRYYSLTAAGTKITKEKSKEMKHFIAGLEHILHTAK